MAPHKRCVRIRAIGALERNERGENAVRRYAEDGTQSRAQGIAARESAKKSSAVEGAVIALNEPGDGLFAIGEVKMEQFRQGTIGRDLEYRPSLRRNSADGPSAVKIPVLPLDKAALW